MTVGHAGAGVAVLRLALAGVAILALGGGPATGEETEPPFEAPTAGT